VTEHDALSGHWALILGASSGFGAATAMELARRGMNIFGVHMDRSTTLPNAERVQSHVQEMGRQAVMFNVNAANPEKRAEVLDAIEEKLRGGQATIRVLFHSLAFGSMGDFIPGPGGKAITQAQLEMTLDVMANSLVYWARDVVTRDLMGPGGRIYAMTSSGSHRILPNYGAVSAAKAALESHIRQIAVDLATRGITANAIQAGITDTAALRKIPGHERLIHEASTRNPMGRMTTPEDVASAVAVLSLPETYFMTGNTIKVDGGEDNVG
jgi:enoyl-[acyl-carrier protein] reductase III